MAFYDSLNQKFPEFITVLSAFFSFCSTLFIIVEFFLTKIIKEKTQI